MGCTGHFRIKEYAPSLQCCPANSSAKSLDQSDASSVKLVTRCVTRFSRILVLLLHFKGIDYDKFPEPTDSVC